MVDYRRIALLFASPFALAAGAAHAEEQHDHDHRAHEAHVHGAWELFAALDDARLSVTLKGPLVDVLGFETFPDSDEERGAVANLREKLKSSEVMVTLDGRARCELVSPAAVVLPAGFPTEDGESASSDAHDHGEHDDHDHHDDHSDHDDHDDHDDHAAHEHEHEHEKHHDDHADHADHDVHTHNLEVTYAFDCASPARLGEITVSGFETFPTIENVDAVFLDDTRQTADRLERGSQTLKID